MQNITSRLLMLSTKLLQIVLNEAGFYFFKQLAIV